MAPSRCRTGESGCPGGTTKHREQKIVTARVTSGKILAIWCRGHSQPHTVDVVLPCAPHAVWNGERTGCAFSPGFVSFPADPECRRRLVPERRLRGTCAHPTEGSQ